MKTAVRKVRTELEEFFCNHLARHIRETIDKGAKPISGVVDKPDFAIEFGGKRIAAELSQVPSRSVLGTYKPLGGNCEADLGKSSRG